MNQAILILGATSSIARSICHSLAAAGHPLFLAGRDEQELFRLSQDYKIRYGVDVRTGYFDADSYGGHDLFVQHVVRQMGGLQGVLVCFGYLGNHEKASKDFSEAEKIILRNFTSACSILTPCAEHLERQGNGFIIGISSVAGERGKQSNYIHGAAKAGLTIFLQGLRNRLYHSGVHVLTVKLRAVDTSSFFGQIEKNFVSCPDKIGKKIINALQRGRNQVYLPWYWGLLTGLSRQLPEFLHKRLKL